MCVSHLSAVCSCRASAEVRSALGDRARSLPPALMRSRVHQAAKAASLRAEPRRPPPRRRMKTGGGAPVSVSPRRPTSCTATARARRTHSNRAAKRGVKECAARRQPIRRTRGRWRHIRHITTSNGARTCGGKRPPASRTTARVAVAAAMTAAVAAWSCGNMRLARAHPATPRPNRHATTRCVGICCVALRRTGAHVTTLVQCTRHSLT